MSKVNVNVQHGVEDRLGREWERHSAELDLLHVRTDDWAVPSGCSALVGEPVQTWASGPNYSTSLHMLEGAAATLRVSGGSASCAVSASTPARALTALAEMRALLPAGSTPGVDVVPITFWTYSPHGARSTRRDIDAQSWEEVSENYTPATAQGIWEMVSPSFVPGRGGQLLLWTGEPGTGKSTMLRTLAREWRGWADMHYVVDSDRFFGSHADYMLDVMMREDSSPENSTKGDGHRWRLLILEDCGEMLRPDARVEVGSALGRFLNVCDGLIGRGLRIMVLVTTNEPVGKLHEAVSRPGRCAARVEFEPIGPQQATSWLKERGVERYLTRDYRLADLYARLNGNDREAEASRPVGFADAWVG